MQKVLQRFNINGDTKYVSTLLAPHFKLKATISPTSIRECEYMTHVPYISTVGTLMYAMVCTRLDYAQVISMVSRYMYDLDNGHWKAVK